MRRVYRESALPLIADESCIAEADVARCQGHFHGDQYQARQVRRAHARPADDRRGRRLGLKMMVGCMTESTVGISAIAQLLPLLDYVDMDGAALLARDIATGVLVDRGKCIYPSIPGNGVQLLPTS